jgi:septal ring factor EnvC (AmiA/AmiB activator)
MKRLVVCTLLGCLIVGNSYCFDEPIVGVVDEHVTPSDIKQLEQKLKQEITELKQEMKQEITGLKQEITGVKQEITGVKQKITGVKQEITKLSDLLIQLITMQQNKKNK